MKAANENKLTTVRLKARLYSMKEGTELIYNKQEKHRNGVSYSFTLPLSGTVYWLTYDEMCKYIGEKEIFLAELKR